MSDEEKVKVYTHAEVKSFIEDDTFRFPMSMALAKPFSFGEDELSHITFEREPLAGDLSTFPMTGQLVGDMYGIMGKITGWELPKIKRLRMKDYKRVLAIVQHFLEGSADDGE